MAEKGQYRVLEFGTRYVEPPPHLRPRVSYTRPHGEQPEPTQQSTIGACPRCERVPCEDRVHALWAKGLNGEDV